MNAFDIVVFVLFIILYIQLPGFLLMTALISERMVISADSVLRAFFTGLGALIMEYYLLSPIKIKAVFILFTPIVIVVTILKKDIREKFGAMFKKKEPVRWQFIFIFAAVFIITCVTQRYAFADIGKYEAIYLYQDLSWHIGNVSMLSRGFPFYDFRFSGLHFYYHYFNDLIFGICKYCFDINAYTLLLKCSPILTAYLFSISIYALLKKATSKPVAGFMALLFCGATIPYYMLSVDDKYSLLNYHIFSNINGVAVSLAAVIAVFLAYCSLFEQETDIAGKYIELSILTFVMTGLKGPFAAVMVAAIIFTSVLAAIHERNFRKPLITAMVTFVSLIMPYVLQRGRSSGRFCRKITSEA